MSGSSEAESAPARGTASHRPGRRPGRHRVLAAVTVGAGGAAGTLVRAGLAHTWVDAPGTLPGATLTVNLLGAFLLGVLLGRLALSPDTGWRRTVRLGVGTGFMGGLTTYSTFMVEVTRLTGAAPAGAGEPAALGTGLTYWAGSVLAGVLLATCGLWLAQALPAPRPAVAQAAHQAQPVRPAAPEPTHPVHPAVPLSAHPAPDRNAQSAGQCPPPGSTPDHVTRHADGREGGAR